MRERKLTRIEFEQCVRDGLTHKQVMDKYNAVSQTVYNLEARYGLKLNRENRIGKWALISDEQIAQLMESSGAEFVIETMVGLGYTRVSARKRLRKMHDNGIIDFKHKKRRVDMDTCKPIDAAFENLKMKLITNRWAGMQL